MADGAAFCSNCGQAFSVAAAAPRAPMMGASVAVPMVGGVAAIPAYAVSAAVPRVEYAGFCLVLIPLIFLTGFRTFLYDFHPNEDMNDAGIFMIIGLVLLVATGSLVLTWLYHALMESSEWQATVGKRVLGLVVTDMAGQRVP